MEELLITQQKLRNSEVDFNRYQILQNISRWLSSHVTWNFNFINQHFSKEFESNLDWFILV